MRLRIFSFAPSVPLEEVAGKENIPFRDKTFSHFNISDASA
jgi:hypothetical protein